MKADHCGIEAHPIHVLLLFKYYQKGTITSDRTDFKLTSICKTCCPGKDNCYSICCGFKGEYFVTFRA